MANLIGIGGESGSGKSTSIGNVPELEHQGLDPKETAIVNVSCKPLPFRSAGYKIRINQLDDTTNPPTYKKIQGGNVLNSKSPNEILAFMVEINQNPNVKNVVIDDFQYVMADELMNKAHVKGYEKFTQIAANGYFLLMNAIAMRPDINVYVLTHIEPVNTKDEEYTYKLKTIGKMLDQQITLEGLFTILLFADVERDPETKAMKRVFVTNATDKFRLAKSPIGMFPELKMANDLYTVNNLIKNYYK